MLVNFTECTNVVARTRINRTRNPRGAPGINTCLHISVLEHKRTSMLVSAKEDLESARERERERERKGKWGNEWRRGRREEGGWLRVQTKVSLQPAPRLHIMCLLAPRASCALRYLSLILSFFVLLVTAFYRRSPTLFSTLILFVLSMLYTAEVTSERNVLLPGVSQEIYHLFFPMLYVFPLLVQLVCFRRCAAKFSFFFLSRKKNSFFHSIQDSANDTPYMWQYKVKHIFLLS